MGGKFESPPTTRWAEKQEKQEANRSKQILNNIGADVTKFCNCGVQK